MKTPNVEELLAKAERPARDALSLHPYYRGKIQMMPKCPAGEERDLALWYTPGVAAPCRAIVESPDAVYDHTNRGNTIAIVSDGSRVLGLGNIGPEAGLPVMEGKALLFKLLGGVDAVPLCIRAQTSEEIIEAVRLIEPSFGGVNLEDIAQPKCFCILDALQDDLGIPVWHDDQQGTALVLLAALENALKVVGKNLENIRIVMVGMGAANVAVYRLLVARGLDPRAIVACDSAGPLHRGRADIETRQEEYAAKWRVCRETNADKATDEIGRAFRGADVCIAFSRPGPDIIDPAWIASMADDAVVFACANPIPEIWPWDAKDAGARIVGTGRGDFLNQVNNSLGFPGVFRGVLDVRANAISNGMAIAAANALAGCIGDSDLDEERILPRMTEWKIAARIAAATGSAAQAEGLARVVTDSEALYTNALETIRSARHAMDLLVEGGAIQPLPELE